jgi:hypothetical protein
LTEGVDVPAIDAVLFADPRQSKIDIVQAAGRAMRRFAGKELGYIIVPVIIDEDSDEPSDDAFDQIITVVSALAMEDDRIVEQFKSLASGKSSEGKTIAEIDVPEYVRIEFGDLLQNIEARIWERLGRGWEKGFERLKAFVRAEGHARPPHGFIDDTGYLLGHWALRLRQDYKKGIVSSQRRRLVEVLPGWEWDPRDTDFDQALVTLRTFVSREGHSRVPLEYVDASGFKLGRWVANHRQRYRAGKLAEKKVSGLNAVPGWTWNPYDSDYDDALARLKLFATREGHGRVPADYVDEDGFRLGNWVSVRRDYYKKGKLSKDRIAELEYLPGWTWDQLGSDFHEGLERLKAFVLKMGHARVRNEYIDEVGFKLGGWVARRRSSHKQGKLSAEQATALAILPGWTWDQRESDFQEGLERLRAFVAAKGNAKVPAKYVDPQGFALGNWVDVKRAAFRVGKLSPERIAVLEAVAGWTWTGRQQDSSGEG